MDQTDFTMLWLNKIGETSGTSPRGGRNKSGGRPIDSDAPLPSECRGDAEEDSPIFAEGIEEPVPLFEIL